MENFASVRRFSYSAVLEKICIAANFPRDFRLIQQGVTVRLSTGESLTAKGLVGCDGGHSAVRKAVGLALNVGALSDKLSFLADMEISRS